MEEKFQIAGRALPSLVLIGLSLVTVGGCSSEGSSFGMGGTGNTGTSGSGQTTAGNTGMTTQAMGGSSNPSGGNGSTGGNGNTAGSNNPTGGSAGSPAAGGDGALGGSGGSAPQGEPCPKPEGEVCHEFFANDNARNQLNYVDEFKIGQMVNGKQVGPDGVIWTAPVNVTGVNSPRQVEMVVNDAATGGKAIMISVNTGYQEYDLATGMRIANVVLADGATDVRGAIRLDNGNTILGRSNDKLRTVNKDGATVGSECTLPGAGGDSLRVLNRDPASGNLLLGRLLDLFIVNAQCQQQWTAKLPNGAKAYSVFPRAGGGVYATTGAPSTIVEIDNGGQVVSQVGGKDVHPGLGLDFFSGFEILPNGNFVAANWQGHVASPDPNTPHLVEFTPDNQLVWKWGNQTVARQITNTLMIR